MPSPSFSIVMPTYQRREMVCEVVRAMCRLSYDGRIEIIVVVDGSTDGTANALLQSDCPFPMRIVEQRNLGQAAARNRGASEAGGEILLFLDDDMIAEPDLVQQHARLHLDGAEAVTGEIPIRRNLGEGLVSERLAAAAAFPRSERVSVFSVYSGNLSIRTSVFRELGGFDEDLRDGEDLELGIRLAGRFDVRHNAAAVAWQVNLVSPTEHMRRARRLAASDLHLIAKHPGVAGELLSHRGAPTGGSVPLAFRLGRLPLVPRLVATTAAGLTQIAQRTPFRSSSTLARFYFTARASSYWSAFRTPAGEAILRRQGCG